MKSITRLTLEREVLLEREWALRQARSSLWDFCRLLAPDFYKDNRTHLKIICDVLQAMSDGKLLKPDGTAYRKLMLNIPPRHGKSRTLINFCKWALGLSKQNRIICCSYNDDIATDFSRYTRDGINEPKTYPHETVYSDIFPDSTIKYGDASFKQWALKGEFFNYKGAGVGGSITGKGCNIAIIDDPVKDAETAYNENALDKIWQWYTGTFLSRLEENAIEIMNMTRWAKGDLCGRILAGDEADQWYVLKMEAVGKDGEMLCPALLSKQRYYSLAATMDSTIFRANYHQEPIDIKGTLYKNLKVYGPDELPKNKDTRKVEFDYIGSYADTADEGNDYLCVIVFGVFDGEVYILNVYYTKEGMEVTEPATARLLFEGNANLAKIESNNGGRGFARNVQRLIWEKHKTRRVAIKWFHQSKNKMARILSNSNYIMQHCYFPWNWKNRWPMFHAAITSFQKEGKNKYDDAPDALTGVAEMVDNPNTFKATERI